MSNKTKTTKGNHLIVRHEDDFLEIPLHIKPTSVRLPVTVHDYVAKKGTVYLRNLISKVVLADIAKESVESDRQIAA